MSTPKAHVLVAEAGVIHISPFGFYSFGTKYLRVAKLARTDAGSDFSPVPYYLYCRALELFFKAYLLAHKVPKSTLKAKKVGHRLDVLLSMARDHGLETIVPITVAQEAEIVKANNYYAGKDLEYFEPWRAATAFQGLPDLALLETTASLLADRLRSICLSAA